MRNILARARRALNGKAYEALRQEVADLRKLAERQAAVISGNFEGAELVDMRGGSSAGGGLDIRLAGGPCQYIAEYLFQMMRLWDKEKPANYVETECFPGSVQVQHRSGERYVLTIQRVHGLTPSEKERQATNRADVAERALERLIAEREESRRRAEPAAGAPDA